ncbi:restriction endonuclease subunit S [Clostridium weizhouense]|uniref:Restriction endonuclease subunit S n=1 Tax=Clostridium weizhouense TaxID=2859781 RepID=A0ABS7AJD3_9CLOT|nr:restriction endonuclease subunit S [Clostridium weizhouense]MBW6408775.1 restriction endonuclease subunit S [Clostridium weizhouense]
MTRKMKDSGVEWIGEIPEGWSIRRLRFLCSINTGNKDTVNAKTDGQYPFYVRSPKIEKIDTYTFDGEAVLTAGDGVGAGKVFHYINGKFDYHQRVYNLHSFENIKGKYVYYYLKENFIKEIEKSNAKSTVDSVRLPMLLNFPIVLPSIDEQSKIISYLDNKCNKIDQTIEKEKQVIEKLKEYKQSIITEAVTKGLNHDVKIKYSGVEWIGKIPEHWENRKLKSILSETMQYGANESGELYNNNDPRYIRITDITLDNKLKDNGKLSLPIDIAKPYLLDEGDILFARSGATVGKSFIFKEEFGLSAFAGYLIKAKINKNNAIPLFVYYYTLSNSYNEWKNRIFIQATIQNIGADKYSNMNIAIPPIVEQQEIVDYLDKKCSAIDKLITNKEKVIEKLTEYKKSLIYECVTGKREV